MKVFSSTNISKKYARSSLAIGNFDGIHKGHQKVFRYAKKYAKKNKKKFCILTFFTLTIIFFNKKTKK